MFKTKRKRAVVLALLAFFCTAATTYVAVDWRRFGGGFLAFLKGGKSDSAVAATGSASGSKGERMVAGDSLRAHDAALPRLVVAGTRKHPSGAAGGGTKSDEDLFKYGDPAAGGIPPGSFIVAQNDTPAGGGAPDIGGTPTDGGGTGPGVSSPAPAPGGTTGGTTGGTDDIGLHGTGKTPAASPPPDTPPSPPPPADTPPSLPPVSSIPESSPLAMMGLGALFLAVAAARKRQQG